MNKITEEDFKIIKKYNIRTGIINTYPLIERIRISEIGNIFFTPFTWTHYIYLSVRFFYKDNSKN